MICSGVQQPKNMLEIITFQYENPYWQTRSRAFMTSKVAQSAEAEYDGG